MSTKRVRWTILRVDEDLIWAVRRYAHEHGYSIATALRELVKDGLGLKALPESTHIARKSPSKSKLFSLR